MTPRELIEKWEREADTAEHVLQRTGGSPEGQRRVEDQIEKNREHAAELRAALPEQPLSRKYRHNANKLRQIVDKFCDDDDVDQNALAMLVGISDIFRKVAANLDAQHDNGRELLESLRDPETGCWCDPVRGIHTPECNRIRKHLEPSDEAQ